MKSEQEIKDHIKTISTNGGDSLTNFITLLALLWVLDNSYGELSQYTTMLESAINVMASSIDKNVNTPQS